MKTSRAHFWTTVILIPFLGNAIHEAATVTGYRVLNVVALAVIAFSTGSGSALWFRAWLDEREDA